ncbi:MAG TPA: aminopeptidase P family protein [Vitreimonas sp.]|nr:aminopeptidase P family protein [Vitreimonas sp.]
MRIDQLQKNLSAQEGILLANPSDVSYFTGFEILVPEEREALLLITAEASILFHATFSPVPNQPGVIALSGCSPEKLLGHFQNYPPLKAIRKISVDTTSLFVNEYQALEKAGLELSPFDRNLSWSIRAIKDAQEIELLKKAGEIAQQTYQAVITQLKPGITEETVKEWLELELRRRGAQRPAFPTIVCFGAHGALPHHQPTSQALQPETPVLIDFGATYQGYRSDMTRSFWFGTQPSAEFQKVEKLVTSAYDAALALIKDRNATTIVTASQLDQAARTLIDQAGYGKAFIHTTGHGVGLDIHEQPSLYQTNTTRLQPGMVITIEPGIYLVDNFGYRYENTVLITEKSAQELTL